MEILQLTFKISHLFYGFKNGQMLALKYFKKQDYKTITN